MSIQNVYVAPIAPPQVAPKVEMMPIEYLEPNPFQVRSIDVANLGGLIRSIEKFGFIGVLEARPNPYTPLGKLQLVYGHRRLRAAELAGLKKVPVRRVDYSDQVMRQLVYIENGTVESLSPYDEGLHFKSFQDAGMSMQQIADVTHKSKGYVQARLDLLRLPEGPIKEAAKKNELDITFFTVLLNYPPELQMSRFEAAQRGEVTATQLRQERASLREGDHLIAEFTKPQAASTIPLVSPEIAAAEASLALDEEVEGPDTTRLADQVLRRTYFDSTLFSAKNGRDWAERVLVQMRGVVPILEANCAKADFTTLSEGEVEELLGLRNRTHELLSQPELVLV